MATPDAPSTLESEKLPDTPVAAKPFNVVNRISLFLLLGACLGFAVAIVGYITDSFWIAVAGSCTVLAMALGWTAAASYALATIAPHVFKAVLILKNRRPGSKNREP